MEIVLAFLANVSVFELNHKLLNLNFNMQAITVKVDRTNSCSVIVRYNFLHQQKKLRASCNTAAEQYLYLHTMRNS